MFAIKVYHGDSMDYSVYSAEDYKVEDVPALVGYRRRILLNVKHSEEHNDLIRTVDINSTAYVMNDTGKTIDTIHPATLPQGCAVGVAAK
jgi:predicted ATP-grasp superfamily ATP-dependent carboligase